MASGKDDDVVQRWIDGEDLPEADPWVEEDEAMPLQAFWCEDDVSPETFADMWGLLVGSDGALADLMHQVHKHTRPEIMIGREYRLRCPPTPESLRSVSRTQYLEAAAALGNFQGVLEGQDDPDNQARVQQYIDTARNHWLSSHDLLRQLTGIQ